MTAIFLREVGELYISSYAVEPSRRGNRTSRTLFDATIQAATDHGDIRVVRGIPSGPNLEVLTDENGQVVGEYISQTPWAKVLADLGFETVFMDGMMESRRKDAI